MSSLTKQKKIEFLVAKVSDLPTLPDVVYSTIQIINNPNSSVRQISEAIAKDQSLSVRVLRLANSSYYALPGGASSVERAVTALGLETVSQLVFTAAVFSKFDLESNAKFNIREFWKHSLGVAIASETIGREVGAADRSLIFLAGLVHDIGKLAHFQLVREDWLAICEFAATEKVTIHEAEATLQQIPHDVLGYELVKKWQLPLLIQEVVQFHHEPAILLNETQVNSHAKAVGIVYIANLLVHSMKFGSSGHSAIRNPSKEVVRHLLGSERALVHILKSVRDQLGRVDPLVNAMMGTDQQKSV